MRSSFSFSPSSMRSTGTPVQRETTPATWSAVTVSSTMAPRVASEASMSFSFFSSSGMRP